jgi:hypothetical protein
MSSFSEGFFYFLAPLYAKIRKGGKPVLVPIPDRKETI